MRKHDLIRRLREAESLLSDYYQETNHIFNTFPMILEIKVFQDIENMVAKLFPDLEGFMGDLWHDLTSAAFVPSNILVRFVDSDDNAVEINTLEELAEFLCGGDDQ